jgi:hypothetical protein
MGLGDNGRGRTRSTSAMEGGCQSVAQMTTRRDPRGSSCGTRRDKEELQACTASLPTTTLPGQRTGPQLLGGAAGDKGGPRSFLDVTRPTCKELGPSTHLACPSPTFCPFPTTALQEETAVATLTLPLKCSFLQSRNMEPTMQASPSSWRGSRKLGLTSICSHS